MEPSPRVNSVLELDLRSCHYRSILVAVLNQVHDGHVSALLWYPDPSFADWHSFWWRHKSISICIEEVSNHGAHSGIVPVVVLQWLTVLQQVLDDNSTLTGRWVCLNCPEAHSVCPDTAGFQRRCELRQYVHSLCRLTPDHVFDG